MFTFGWGEIFLIFIIVIVVIGPKDLPKVLKSIMSFVRKIKSMAYDFQNTVDDMANETELNDLRNDVTNLRESKLLKETKSEINVLNKINNETKSDIERDIKKIKK